MNRDRLNQLEMPFINCSLRLPAFTIYHNPQETAFKDFRFYVFANYSAASG